MCTNVGRSIGSAAIRSTRRVFGYVAAKIRDLAAWLLGGSQSAVVTDPIPIIVEFEKKWACDEAGALLQSATYAVDRLAHLSDLDQQIAQGHARFAVPRQDQAVI